MAELSEKIECPTNVIIQCSLPIAHDNSQPEIVLHEVRAMRIILADGNADFAFLFVGPEFSADDLRVKLGQMIECYAPNCRTNFIIVENSAHSDKRPGRTYYYCSLVRRVIIAVEGGEFTVIFTGANFDEEEFEKRIAIYGYTSVLENRIESE